MQLKLNSNAIKEMLVQRDLISLPAIAGITSQNVSGLNSGLDLGGGNHAASFVETMAGTGGYGITSVRGLFLFKGTPVTQDELDTYLASAPLNITDTAVIRYNDLLVKFLPQSQQTTQGTILNSFNPANAINTGTATWFIYGAFASTSYNNRPSYLVGGTVTGAGGGGDIELLSTSFVSGNAYRMPMYELKLPSKFST